MFLEQNENETTFSHFLTATNCLMQDWNCCVTAFACAPVNTITGIMVSFLMTVLIVMHTMSLMAFHTVKHFILLHISYS